MTPEQLEQAEIEAHTERYEAALHAIQSAVKFRMEIDPKDDTAGHSPKHLRVGVDSAHVSDAALLRLLMAKGIVTQLEFIKELADEAEREVQRYVEHFQKRGFNNVRFL